MTNKHSGFSLVELMIVLVVVLTISGAIMQVINLAGQRSTTEQNKVDVFQEAREFMDQMARDLRQAGYPSPRNIDPSVLTVSPTINDHHAAVGLVSIGPGDLVFEGDMAGTGIVSVVHYHLETTGSNCPCLRRSELDKVDGDPVSGQTTPVYQVEVQGVQNTTIFSAYNNGVAVGPTLDISSGGTTVATIDTVQAVLTLKATIMDPQTKQYPQTTLVTTIRLNNCSQAAIGYKTSCQ